MDHQHRRILSLLLDALKLIQQGDRLANHGICANVLHHFRNKDVGYAGTVLIDWFPAQLPKWPEYSGDHHFPVKEPGDYRRGDYYFYLVCVNESQWEGEYGEARLRLLEFLINQAETELSAMNQGD